MPRLNAYFKGIAPKASTQDLSDMMWSCTPYPLSQATLRKTRRQLRKYFKLGGNSVDGAVRYSHDELDYEFEIYSRQERGQDINTPPLAPPKAYSKRPPPEHAPTREYSKKLNRALKYRDVTRFSLLMKTPPPGLELGWWLDDLVRQLTIGQQRSPPTQKAQSQMLSAMLDSQLELPRTLFSWVLENRNYGLLELLLDRGRAPPPNELLHREVFWQLMDGLWPHPERWCPDVLTSASYFPSFTRFFPSILNPHPAAFRCEHIQRLATLEVNEPFKFNASQAYAKNVNPESLGLMITADNAHALGMLINLGWVDEQKVLENAQPHQHAQIIENLRHASQVFEHATLNCLTPQATSAKTPLRL